MKTFHLALLSFFIIVGCQSRQNEQSNQLDQLDSEDISIEQNSSEPINQTKAQDIIDPILLNYEVVEKEDISYANTPRMVYRIVLKVDSLPHKKDMQYTAENIWDDGNEKLKEFTVFMYLPEMNTHFPAFGIGEFNPDGLVSFDVNTNALYDTKWEVKKPETPNIEVPEHEKKEYSIDINANNEAGKIVKIRITSNFPDGTNLSLTILRSHYLKGKQEEYSGSLYRENFTLENGVFETVALINDSEWYNEHQRLVRALPDDIPPISKISDNIKISAMYTPAADQPQDVEKILGENGEYVYGEGSKKFGKMRTFWETIELYMPFEK